jgi:hypothetical protein
MRKEEIKMQFLQPGKLEVISSGEENTYKELFLRSAVSAELNAWD